MAIVTYAVKWNQSFSQTKTDNNNKDKKKRKKKSEKTYTKRMRIIGIYVLQTQIAKKEYPTWKSCELKWKHH